MKITEMKTMRQMQMEMLYRHQAASKDANDFPKLHVCPFTGVVKMHNNQREQDAEKWIVVAGVIGGLALSAILVFFVT